MKKITFERLADFKNYIPKPHPMQHRIDEFRSIPSLYKLQVAEFKLKLEVEFESEEELEDYDEPISKVEEEVETDRDTIMEKIYDKL